MCLFLRVALHQSMIRAEQFCKGAHQELSGERRGQEWSVSRCTTTPEPTPQSLCSATREAITIDEPTCLNYRVVPTCCNKRKPINSNKDPTEPINKYIKTEKRCLKKKIQNYCQESFIHATPLESYPHRQDLESKQQQIDIQ